MLQVDESVTGSPPLTGEQRLLAAIIEQALDDLKRAAHREEARRWLLSNSERPLGFRWVCSLLGLHPENVKRMAKLTR